MAEKVVAISGGFDPIHVGHIRLIKEAKQLGDKLVVIMNNDNWLETKKGFCFMNQEERKEILEAIEEVDEVVLTEHRPNDPIRAVCKEIGKISPHVFANGGDRSSHNTPEEELCKKLNIELAYNVGGEKVQSSSDLASNLKNR